MREKTFFGAAVGEGKKGKENLVVLTKRRKNRLNFVYFVYRKRTQYGRKQSNDCRMMTQDDV
jgi:hypothetical protein